MGVVSKVVRGVARAAQKAAHAQPRQRLSPEERLRRARQVVAQVNGMLAVDIEPKEAKVLIPKDIGEAKDGELCGLWSIQGCSALIRVFRDGGSVPAFRAVDGDGNFLKRETRELRARFHGEKSTAESLKKMGAALAQLCPSASV